MNIQSYDSALPLHATADGGSVILSIQ